MRTHPADTLAAVPSLSSTYTPPAGIEYWKDDAAALPSAGLTVSAAPWSLKNSTEPFSGRSVGFTRKIEVLNPPPSANCGR